MEFSAKKCVSNGFTLVELVVVIAIIAILAGVGGAAYSGYITRAKDAGDYVILDAVSTAVFSTMATENLSGTVTEISVTKNDKTVNVKIDSASAVDFATTYKKSFGLFFAEDLTKLNCASATWSATANSGKGGWELTH